MKKGKKIVTLLFLFCLLAVLAAGVSASEVKTGWVKSGKNIFYYDKAGNPYKNGIYSLTKGGRQSLYIFDMRGRLVRSRVLKIKGKLYLCYKDGRVLTSPKKVKIGKKTYFFYGTPSGFLRTGLVEEAKYGTMYFSPAKNGRAIVDAWQLIGGNMYFFDQNGRALKNGVYQVRKHYYYFDQYGHRLYGLQQIGDGWYGFNPSNGRRLSGWQTLNGSTYYFDGNNSGRAVTGGFYNIGGKVYYFNSSGVRQTGWMTMNEHRYYMDPGDNGARSYGTKTVDGVSYNFGTEGYVSYSPNRDVILRVNRANCVVTVYNGDAPFKAITCSVGAPGSPTPTGTFRIKSHHRWWMLNGPSVGQYCSHFLDSYLFHSVPMYGSSFGNQSNVRASDYNKLGQPASGGCIRVCVADAKWIYENVPIGAKVVISDSEPMPLGKPVPLRMPEGTVGRDPSDIW